MIFVGTFCYNWLLFGISYITGYTLILSCTDGYFWFFLTIFFFGDFPVQMATVLKQICRNGHFLAQLPTNMSFFLNTNYHFLEFIDICWSFYRKSILLFPVRFKCVLFCYLLLVIGTFVTNITSIGENGYFCTIGHVYVQMGMFGTFWYKCSFLVCLFNYDYC